MVMKTACLSGTSTACLLLFGAGGSLVLWLKLLWFPALGLWLDNVLQELEIVQTPVLLDGVV